MRKLADISAFESLGGFGSTSLSVPVLNGNNTQRHIIVNDTYSRVDYTPSDKQYFKYAPEKYSEKNTKRTFYYVPDDMSDEDTIETLEARPRELHQSGNGTAQLDKLGKQYVTDEDEAKGGVWFNYTDRDAVYDMAQRMIGGCARGTLSIHQVMDYLDGYSLLPEFESTLFDEKRKNPKHGWSAGHDDTYSDMPRRILRDVLMEAADQAGCGSVQEYLESLQDKNKYSPQTLMDFSGVDVQKEAEDLAYDLCEIAYDRAVESDEMCEDSTDVWSLYESEWERLWEEGDVTARECNLLLKAYGSPEDQEQMYPLNKEDFAYYAREALEHSDVFDGIYSDVGDGLESAHSNVVSDSNSIAASDYAAHRWRYNNPAY